MDIAVVEAEDRELDAFLAALIATLMAGTARRNLSASVRRRRSHAWPNSLWAVLVRHYATIRNERTAEPATKMAVYELMALRWGLSVRYVQKLLSVAQSRGLFIEANGRVQVRALRGTDPATVRLIQRDVKRMKEAGSAIGSVLIEKHRERDRRGRAANGRRTKAV